jgi:superoxide dismutase, Fe-Mn family
MENLRTLMLEAADAMFGNGFVWLMIDHSAERTPRILNTYNAGSPWPGAHTRQQSHDVATTSMSERLQRMTVPQNYVGAWGDTSRFNARSQPNALQATPVLCVNVWQYMYVLDYGVLGKRQYLNAWWERIDWAQVADLYNVAPHTESLMRGAAASARATPRSFLTT